MRNFDSEKRGWSLVLILLLIGLLLVIAAGNLAIRFAPRWSLAADMGSRLDPNSAYLTPLPDPVFQPLDPAILTPPVWINVFLTPGVRIPTRLPKATGTPVNTAVPTQGMPTVLATVSPTRTLVSFTATQIYNPAATKTSTKPSSPPAGTPTSTSTGISSPTGTVIPPSVTAVSSLTPSRTPVPQADLQVSNTDHATAYEAGGAVQYVMVASNTGPGQATGAAFSAAFSSNLDPASIGWTCVPSGGASCTANGAGPISDTIHLPAGAYVTYTISAVAVASPGGDLTSTATVSIPAGVTDTNPANNQAVDVNQLIVPISFPYGNIDPVKHDSIEYVLTNTSITLEFGSPLAVGGHAGYDLIYYELPQGSNPGIWMDCVRLQLGDGRNWFTILNWGDNYNDHNASMNMSTIGATSEVDNHVVDASYMTDLTGVALQLDGVVPDGSYKYIRIISPPAPLDDGDGVEVDAIYVIP